ncbi:MAG: redox-regulated ATPase YchF [Nanoarchaeota archaeon]|nr:redox-regulated ATPase YchF [Nanoarchaeota archaeon]
MLVGVVGKANVGKSTFFKALTLANIEIDNYPFVTIKPNHGIGYVRIECADKFFNVKCNPREGYCINHNRFVPVDLIDVAGLVPGAYEGKGMGNQFLDDLRQADVLIHIVDASGSTNELGEPVTHGSYDPCDDIRFLEIELDMWYLRLIKKGWDRFARAVQQEKEHEEKIVKDIAKHLSGLKVNEEMVEEVLSKLDLDRSNILSWGEEDLKEIAIELRKKTKKMIIAANKIDVSTAKENLSRMKKEFPNYLIIGCSAESELALKEASKNGLIEYIPGDNDFKISEPDKLNEKQKNALEFIKKNVLDVFQRTGVQQVINAAVFDLLKYIAVFPVGAKLADSDGNILPDCFLIPQKTTALDFAYRLHTDFGNNFIKAIDVKNKITIGKDHPLKNGDVVEIISGK